MAGKGWALIQQANRAFKGCWAQVHVPLRRGQIPVACQLLNGPSRSPAHRQMRAKRMPEHMYADGLEVRPSSGPLDQALDEPLRQRLAIVVADLEET
jgi:hypothetical protein